MVVFTVAARQQAWRSEWVTMIPSPVVVMRTVFGFASGPFGDAAPLTGSRERFSFLARQPDTSVEDSPFCGMRTGDSSEGGSGFGGVLSLRPFGDSDNGSAVWDRG
jgi:hypothetical protein